LIQLGFKPLQASGLSLIANTAPVAYGALGTAIIALAGVTGLDLHQLSAMAGRQLPFFSLIVPFWVVWTFAGFRGMLGVWPAALTAGVSFAIPQFLVSNYHGPWLVDIVAAACSMLCLAGFLRVWKPAGEQAASARDMFDSRYELPRESTPFRVAVMPWVILTVIVFAWGTPQVKTWLNHISAPSIVVPG